MRLTLIQRAERRSRSSRRVEPLTVYLHVELLADRRRHAVLGYAQVLAHVGPVHVAQLQRVPFHRGQFCNGTEGEIFGVTTVVFRVVRVSPRARSRISNDNVNNE